VLVSPRSNRPTLLRLFDPEDEGGWILVNVDVCLCRETVQNCRRLESSAFKFITVIEMYMVFFFNRKLQVK